jgi:hypothetical protein
MTLLERLLQYTTQYTVRLQNARNRLGDGEKDVPAASAANLMYVKIGLSTIAFNRWFLDIASWSDSATNMGPEFYSLRLGFGGYGCTWDASDGLTAARISRKPRSPCRIVEGT